MPPRAPAAAGASDEMYGVVSVLYHALQGADTYEQYIEDARTAGDEELVAFFEECREEEVARAQRAKSLLADRLEASDEGADDDESDDEDDEDEDDDEN